MSMSTAARRPTLLIAIGAGGFVPARILRSCLKARYGTTPPVQAIGLSLYEDGLTECGKGAVVRRTQWLAYAHEATGAGRGRCGPPDGSVNLQGQRVLIVDEVRCGACDSQEATGDPDVTLPRWTSTLPPCLFTICRSHWMHSVLFLFAVYRALITPTYLRWTTLAGRCLMRSLSCNVTHTMSRKHGAQQSRPAVHQAAAAPPMMPWAGHHHALESLWCTTSSSPSRRRCLKSCLRKHTFAVLTCPTFGAHTPGIASACVAYHINATHIHRLAACAHGRYHQWYGCAHTTLAHPPFLPSPHTAMFARSDIWEHTAAAHAPGSAAVELHKAAPRMASVTVHA